jgi:hypothetical protein
MKNSYIYFENVKGRDHLGVTGVDEWMILKRILKKLNIRMWTGFIWLGIGDSGGIL